MPSVTSGWAQRSHSQVTQVRAVALEASSYLPSAFRSATQLTLDTGDKFVDIKWLAEEVVRAET